MRAIATALALASALSVPTVDIQPSGRTQPVPNDPDDPAVWVNAKDPSRSLIIGTNKVMAPQGALVVFALDGSIRQLVSGIDRPNNVDVEYGSAVGDIAVTTERLKQQLRIFRINPDESGITDVTSAGNTRVFTDRSGEQAAPMGVSLYRRPRDGAIFAIVAPKAGPRQGYLAQYRLENDAKGYLKATFVRYFGTFSGVSEIEAVVVDDEAGHVYYADEGSGIHQYPADPDSRGAGREIAVFGQTGYRGDREGIAIFAGAGGKGYIVCTDQLPGNSEYHIYHREGNHKELRIVRAGADSTDGLEITSRSLGPAYPDGLMVAMNASGRNFLLYRWSDVMRDRR